MIRSLGSSVCSRISAREKVSRRMRRMRMAGKLIADPDWSYSGHFRPQRKAAAVLRHQRPVSKGGTVRAHAVRESLVGATSVAITRPEARLIATEVAPTGFPAGFAHSVRSCNGLHDT